MEKKDTNKVCPVCGSANVVDTTNQEHYSVPFGPDIQVSAVTRKCGDCGSEIDLTDDSSREKALTESAKASVESMLSSLLEQGYTYANLERTLSLPQRTLSRWKAGNDPSAAGLALLRIVRTYPWITDVADHRFNPSVAQQVLVAEAGKAITGFLRTQNHHLSEMYVAQSTDPSSTVTIHAEFSEGLRQSDPFMLQDKSAIGSVSYEAH